MVSRTRQVADQLKLMHCYCTLVTLYVVLHLVGDQPRSDLVSQLHPYCVVVGCEILGAFFVSNLENSDCMVA
jgi:hypothetical protein